MRSFVALLWKELHEGAKWMAVGLLAMSAVFVYALHQQVGTPSFNAVQGGMSIMASLFLTMTTFGAAIVGAMIGLSQILPENRGDKWGFLTHRPVSRSTLFAAKVLSGLMLYIVATGVPLACAAAWVATPGHLAAPFDWRMTQPAIADLSCGVVYYFAALMTGMRISRWFGSRAFAFGVAIVCSFFMQLPRFWEAELACAIGVLIVATAAWGSFISGGMHIRKPLIARCAEALTIGIGSIVVAGIIVEIIIPLLPSPPEDYKRINYQVTRDGIVARIVSEGNTVKEVTDLHGVPLPQFQSPADRVMDKITLGTVTRYLSFGEWRGHDEPNYRDFSKFVQVQLGQRSYGPSQWFYVNRTRLVAEYDTNSARLLGWFGPDGFSAGTTPPAKRFDGFRCDPSYSEEPILADREGAFRVQLVNRKVTRIFTPPPGEQLVFAAQERDDTSSLVTYGDRARFDAFVTDKQLYVQRYDGSNWFTYPLDAGLLSHDGFEVTCAFAAPGPEVPTFLFVYPHWPFPPMTPIDVTELKGAVAVDHFSVPYPWTPSSPAPSQFIVPSVAVPVASFLRHPIFDWNGYQSMTPPPPNTYRWAMEAALISAVISMIIAFNRSVAYRCSFGRTIIWLVLAAGAGPVGVLFLLSIAERPPRERCGSCCRWRGADQVRCRRCNAQASAPPMNGTEIFDPVLVA